MKNTKRKIYGLALSLLMLVFFSGLPDKNAQAGEFAKTVTDFMADGTWVAPGGV